MPLTATTTATATATATIRYSAVLGPEWNLAQTSGSRRDHRLEVVFCDTFLELAGVGLISLPDFNLHDTGVTG